MAKNINAYQALREKQEKQFSEFPRFFAFSDKQFMEGMQELGVASEKDLYKGLGGMFYRKTDAEKLHAMMRRFDDEMTEGYKDDTFLYDAISYELANHEYCITLDAEDTLDALGLTREEFVQDTRMRNIWLKARRDYLEHSVC